MRADWSRFGFYCTMAFTAHDLGLLLVKKGRVRSAQAVLVLAVRIRQRFRLWGLAHCPGGRRQFMVRGWREKLRVILASGGVRRGKESEFGGVGV